MKKLFQIILIGCSLLFLQTNAHAQGTGMGGFGNLGQGILVAGVTLGVAAGVGVIVVIAGNSVAYHTQAKNRLAWGISGAILGIPTLLVGALSVQPFSPEGVAVPLLIASVGAVMFGLGVANIHSSNHPPSRTHHKHATKKPLPMGLVSGGKTYPSKNVGFKFVTFD